MIRLKACPKCHGDMYQDRDQYGVYHSCLQCGYLRDMELRTRKPEPAGEVKWGRRKRTGEARRLWTEEERSQLRCLAIQGLTNEQIGTRLGRSTWSILDEKQRQGLTKSA